MLNVVVVVLGLLDTRLLHVDSRVQPVRLRDRGCERDLVRVDVRLSLSSNTFPPPTPQSYGYDALSPRAHADTIDSRKASLRIRRARTLPKDALKRMVDWSVASGSMVSRKSIEMIVSPTTLSASW